MKTLIITTLIAILIVSVSISAVASERKTNLEADELVRKALVEHYENQCKLTLRALGNTQMAYAHSNNDKNFGNWWSLQRDNFIEPGYNQANLIDQYSICVFFVYTSSYINKVSQHDSKFDIVAIPYQPNTYGLRTFGLCEEQTPLLWIGHDFQWRIPVNFPRTPREPSSLWAILR